MVSKATVVMTVCVVVRVRFTCYMLKEQFLFAVWRLLCHNISFPAWNVCLYREDIPCIFGETSSLCAACQPQSCPTWGSWSKTLFEVCTTPWPWKWASCGGGGIQPVVLISDFSARDTHEIYFKTYIQWVHNPFQSQRKRQQCCGGGWEGQSYASEPLLKDNQRVCLCTKKGMLYILLYMSSY